jgi:glycerol-3-phosphate dehydrogenase
MMIDRVAEASAIEHVQAVVVGGGVVGCAVLRQLAVRGIDAVLLEAEADIGQGSSKANSAILHSGYDAKPGTTEAALLRRSRDLWPELIAELGVPFLPVGAVMLAMSPADRDRLRDEIAPVASDHGVATELVDGLALRDLAPFVATDAVAALHIAAEGIVDPFWLTRAFAESAMAAGARILTSSRVTGLHVENDRVVVTIDDAPGFVADQVFDCAGLRADEIARLAGDASFEIRPRKGQFLVSEQTFGIDRIVLPIPGPMGKGMLITPIIFGGVLLGPTAEDIDDKDDRSTDRATRERVVETCASMVPVARQMVPIRQFAGLRSASSTGDYILRPSTVGDRLHVVAGIRSTGISASAAIAEAVVDDVASRRGWGRRRSVAASQPPEPDWSATAGEVICICRSVAEAEIGAALGQASPATTLDGIKRRSGAGFGDCQGNLCQMDLVARLAVQQGSEPWDVLKDARGSWILAGAANGSPGPGVGVASALTPGPRGSTEAADLIVVGGGLAGIGVALAASEAGRSVIVVDRGREPGGAFRMLATAVQTADEQAAVAAILRAIDDRRVAWRAATTVVGLRSDDSTWWVECQDRRGSDELAAPQLALASGGYVTPREHRGVDGPRPSGVMTADAAFAALERRWLPARRAVVVGRGRVAASVAAALEGSGTAVVLSDGARPVDAVRGNARLEGVRIDGSWVHADALVFADSLSPATFLLRGLGLVDERPGVPAAVDAAGALSLDGLWAAGTCVSADVDHLGSLADGRRVGASIGAADRQHVVSVRGGGIV